jgi:SUR7/PalI family
MQRLVMNWVSLMFQSWYIHDGLNLILSDINKLVGNDLPIQIPEVVVKWITYALVLHIVAFGLAAIAAIFGLLAHIREMSMSCFSSCIAGFAAAIALIAFIFDIAFFFIAKSRLNAVKGGSASFGNAVWLTLAAWVLLFLSGCFYGFGRCCIKRRPRNDRDLKLDPPPGNGNNSGGYTDQMRLDAVKAEADRKARQKQGEIGLPAFHEYDPSQPLHAKVDGDEVYLDEEEGAPYRDNNPSSQQHRQNNQAPSGYSGGYVQGKPGSRAIDEYNSPSRISDNSYPPQANRRNSGHTLATTGYEASQYSYGASTATPPPPNNQYLSTAPYQGHDQYASSPGQDYRHTQNGTSCETISYAIGSISKL